MTTRMIMITKVVVVVLVMIAWYAISRWIEKMGGAKSCRFLFISSGCATVKEISDLHFDKKIYVISEERKGEASLN